MQEECTNIIWSCFNNFKTDLETYIYITLQKAIYDLNSGCSATALVNLTPTPKPSYSSPVSQGPHRRRNREGNGKLALSQTKPPLCFTNTLPSRAPGVREGKAQITLLT